ncbi:glycosyltransferase [Mesorhizobium sp. L-8-3]|uniref:glycosyltransferase n=1 Tax=Mesorhizobium sp. L-8-3 TaxID=2744522 RepID=UPI001FD3B264|nr:glycosyltransferase [Mesorhizobium sp. L-8-3]
MLFRRITGQLVGVLDWLRRNRRRSFVATALALLAANAAALIAALFLPEGRTSTTLAVIPVLAFNSGVTFFLGMLASGYVRSRIMGFGPRAPALRPAPTVARMVEAAQSEPSIGQANPSREVVANARKLLREAVDRLPPPEIDGPAATRAYPIPELGSETACVTIVVPLFNEERFVSDAITSLKGQTVRNFEVLIVDDASTDRSAALAKQAVGDDRRFHLLRHLRNSGLGASRNTGLRLARTPFVTFLDADDILLPDALEIRLRRFGELTDGRIAGVYCGVVQAPETITADYLPRRRNYSGRAQTFVSSEGECPFNAHAPILRTDVLRLLGGFDETLRFGCEDWDMWQRVMRHGYWFEPVNRIAAVYRRKSGSMVRTMPLEHLQSGQRIFNWVHSPLPSEEVVSGTPFVFNEGLDTYRRADNFLRRTVQYGAMAYMRSGASFLELLTSIPGDLWPYALKHFDVPQMITKGLARYLAIDDADTADLGGDLIAARDAILAHYSALQRETRLVDTEPVRSSVDVALFAANLKQAALMADLAARLGENAKNCVLVSAETVSGDQGVEDFWISRKLPYLTYNLYALREWRLAPAVKIVMRPYDGAIRGFATSGPGLLVELVDPAAPVGLPDENAPAVPDMKVALGDALPLVERMLEPEDGPCPANRDQSPGPVAVPARAGIAAPFILHKEERLDLSPDYERLSALKDRYKGERCFIIGNGPSLNALDLSKLKNEHTFAVNGIFYKKDEMGFDPTFYVVEDSSVMAENIDAIRAYEARYKFFPTIYRSLHPAEDNVQFFHMNRGFYEREGASFCVPRFSVDAASRVFCGQSVTYINLQLAYYFGFLKVYMIGMDFSYVIPQNAIVKGDLITSTEADPNHFNPSYFGAGKTWKNPKLDRVKLNYELARDVFSAGGREIINATKGGKLELFRRQAYDDLLE